MSVRKDPSGERSVQAEVEVPGTPEQVWAAIATGPGISSWFVPSTCDEHVGGVTKCNFGPGMESVANLKTWNPPHNFVAEAVEGPGPVATEWIVEARDGGTCLVRVVHRWFASTDDWDAQFEGHTYGWQAFFRILRLYLAHFAGQSCTQIQLSAISGQPMRDCWKNLIEKLQVRVGDARIEPAPESPAIAGRVERMGDEEHPDLLLLLDQPAPGVAHLFMMPMGGQLFISVRFYLYGSQGCSVAGMVEQQWRDWLSHQFPAGV